MKLTSESKFFISILVVTIAIIGIAAVVMTQPEKPPVPVAREELIPSDAHTKGNASASAYLVEFSDYECPSCRIFESTIEKLIEQHKDTLLFSYRHFPLPGHQYAVPAAVAAEAAAKQGKFWEAGKLLFENQNKFSEEFFSTQFAKLAQLDELQFKKDVASQEVKDIVARSLAQARSLKLPGTPSFFLNGVHLKNLESPEDLVTAVEEALK